MKEFVEIKNLEKKCGLFQAFCKQKGLKNGDKYSPIDFIEFCDDLSWEESEKLEKENGERNE